MKRVDYPEGLKTLIRELKRMPGVGPRSAERIALWMVEAADARPREIARAVLNIGEEIHPCELCGFFATGLQCEICADSSRDHSQICVVERATDILPIERTGSYRGRYHALGGTISPLDHVSPDDLRIEALLHRAQEEPLTEIILALSTGVEGEATANYVAALLKGFAVRITKIAQGLPAGGGLGFADELTLSRALGGRREL